MKSRNRSIKHEDYAVHRLLRVSRLQLRMTISYMWVTSLTVILLGSLNAVFLTMVVGSDALTHEVNLTSSTTLTTIVRQQAEIYALEAVFQAKEATLNPQTTFQPGQQASLVSSQVSTAFRIPYTEASFVDPQRTAFALLIAPNGRVFASSAPQRYPSNTPASILLSKRERLIINALSGIGADGTELTSSGSITYVAEPIWSQGHKLLGAIYLQVPEARSYSSLATEPFIEAVFMIGLILLMSPLIGGLFGFMTTRGLIRRVRNLMAATTQVAEGDYAQRVFVSGTDEIGQLEHQFNHMAEQLAESTEQRQKLIEQNVRVSERARISRELHDAVSQDLFSLSMLADGLRMALPATSAVQPQITTLEQIIMNMTREMRALLLEMRPTQLDHLGLVNALEALAQTYRARLGITVTTALVTVALHPKVEHALFRVAQEAVSNAVRHSYATEISICLEFHPGSIALTITDNGKGFSLEEKNGSSYGLGLSLMQERIHELQGTFALDAVPSQGTRIHVNLPQELNDDSSHDS